MILNANLGPLGLSIGRPDDPAVGGVAGQCYKIKARVVGQIERKSISGGIQTPADNALAYRGGTPAANMVASVRVQRATVALRTMSPKTGARSASQSMKIITDLERFHA